MISSLLFLSDLMLNNVWDIDKNGIPKFVNINYIELEKINEISKFRSGIGHDYSDAFEHCRSMKHYYKPKDTKDWTNVKIFSPVTGKITGIISEWAGDKITITSAEYPAFQFTIFHVNTLTKYQVNDQVSAGQQLGTHIGSQTMSDIAVVVNDTDHQVHLISYFQVMTDQLFISYISRGMNARDSIIISETARNADPLFCNIDGFTNTSTLPDWLVLRQLPL